MKKLSFVTILMLIFALCFNSCYSDTSCKPEETPYKSDEMSSDSTISETVPESMVSDYVSGEETTAEITVGEDTASESPQYHPVIDSIPDEFMAVINNTEKFIFCRYSDECEEIYLDVFRFPYMGEKITYGNGVEYAILDMNGDNKLEVVLMSALGDKLVLHCQNGKVYGFDYIFKNMDRIKVDGSFDWSDMTAEGLSYGTSKLDFWGSKVTGIDLCSVQNDGGDQVQYCIGKESVSKQEYLDYCCKLENEEVKWFSFDRYRS